MMEIKTQGFWRDGPLSRQLLGLEPKPDWQITMEAKREKRREKRESQRETGVVGLPVDLSPRLRKRL